MSLPQPVTRHEFLRRSRNATLDIGAGLALPNLFLNQTKAASGRNPGEFIRVSFISTGDQGNDNLRVLLPNAVALCDVDQNHLARTKKLVDEATGRSCAPFTDYRRLLEDKTIDAVVISTPDHRHTSFTRNSGAPSGAKVRLTCQYDSQWRRTQKIVAAWNGWMYVPQSTNTFVYDGWNLMAILDATNRPVQTFRWGTDASGTSQGAGGVGGLLSMTVHQGTNAGTYFYSYDGNHNVAALVNASNGVVAGQCGGRDGKRAV